LFVYWIFQKNSLAIITSEKMESSIRDIIDHHGTRFPVETVIF
jgi:hypothetical protein